MNLDTLLAEAREAAKKKGKKKGKGKAPTKQPSPFKKKTGGPPRPAHNPVTSIWTYRALVLIQSKATCKNCGAHHQGTEPAIYLKSIRTRKNGIPDVHYERVSPYAVDATYSNLQREVEEYSKDVHYCAECFKDLKPQQFNLHLQKQFNFDNWKILGTITGRWTFREKEVKK